MALTDQDRQHIKALVREREGYKRAGEDKEARAQACTDEIARIRKEGVTPKPKDTPAKKAAAEKPATASS